MMFCSSRVNPNHIAAARRPLPAGRVAPPEALTFGISLTVGGIGYLLVSVPHVAAAVSEGTGRDVSVDAARRILEARPAMARTLAKPFLPIGGTRISRTSWRRSTM